MGILRGILGGLWMVYFERGVEGVERAGFEKLKAPRRR
jgi:hypothetical protein